MIRVFVALGGNQGDVLSVFGAALGAMPTAGLKVVGVSPAYRTLALVPEGEPPAPDYWNAVCELATALSPQAVLKELLRLEALAGRVRRRRWESRPLDLDLLLYGEAQVHEPELEVPHPRLMERAFVLLPLHDLAPTLVVPGTARTVAELLYTLPEPTAGVLEQRPDWR